MSKMYRIMCRQPLLFEENDPAGPHLSAASGVAWMNDSLVVIDDASIFAGVFHQAKTPGKSLRLFSPIEGHEQFSETAGTKALKPDLEVLVPLPDGSLLALGSGSRNRGVGSREARGRAVKISPHWQIEVFHLGPLYQKLSEVQDSINVEGALIDGDGLLLFLRGNGRGGKPMIVKILNLEEALAGRPDLGAACEILLPTLHGSALGFTDACTPPRRNSIGGARRRRISRCLLRWSSRWFRVIRSSPRKNSFINRHQWHGFLRKARGHMPKTRNPQLLGVTDPDNPTKPGKLLWLQRE